MRLSAKPNDIGRCARGAGWVLSTLLSLGGLAAPAGAQTPPAADQAPAEAPKSIWERDTLTGDWGGLRTELANQGITFSLTETDEVLGNVSGGLRQGAIVEGVTKMGVGFDLEKLLGWKGGSVTVNAYQIHGRGLSANYVGNLMAASNIEAPSGSRLNDLFLEQSLFDDKLNLRIGQFAADEEFLVSDVAGTFINSTFGWPGIYGVDLPNGPAYPFSAPAVRIRYSPTDKASIQAAVFSGNPLGNDGNPGGIHFPVYGVFAIVEASYSTMPGKDDPSLGGNYKIGGWYNSLRFDDLHMDSTGQSLASSSSNGTPASHKGDYGLYALMDHQIYRVPGTDDGGLSGFARIAAAPQQDRNAVYFYLDAGATWKGTFPGRDNDVVGLAVAWANVSHSLRSLDLDANFDSGVDSPIQSSEVVLELTYQAPITPWLTLQPDFQYVFHPGGGLPQANDPTQALNDAAIFGLRGTITF
ncbi:MAG TPA: carbohydrate porin [Rhodopila sp.]|uniref:carbohydrate porin n=1 Tax=Rhodopila sp. TaxID=2480087 RepID=UPI002C1FE1D0|nr:carbohydrate porin [Rhodopila sp.]HVY13773.1 carbohydrate porin [Rhodopila sp.]